MKTSYALVLVVCAGIVGYLCGQGTRNSDRKIVQPVPESLTVSYPDPMSPIGRSSRVMKVTDTYGVVTADRLPPDVWVVGIDGVTHHAKVMECR